MNDSFYLFSILRLFLFSNNILKSRTRNYFSNRDIFAAVSSSSVLRAPNAADFRLYSFVAARSLFFAMAVAAVTSSRAVSSIFRSSKHSERFSFAFDKFESAIFCASFSSAHFFESDANQICHKDFF